MLIHYINDVKSVKRVKRAFEVFIVIKKTELNELWNRIKTNFELLPTTKPNDFSLVNFIWEFNANSLTLLSRLGWKIVWEKYLLFHDVRRSIIIITKLSHIHFSSTLLCLRSKAYVSPTDGDRYSNQQQELWLRVGPLYSPHRIIYALYRRHRHAKNTPSSDALIIRQFLCSQWSC